MTGRRIDLYAALLCGLSILLAARVLGFGNFELFLIRLSNVDVISFAVLAVAVWRLLRSSSMVPFTATDIAGAFALAAASIGLAFVPSAVGIGAGFGGLGATILLRESTDRDLRAAGICLLALAGHLCLAPIVFRVFLDPILQIDRYLLGLAFSLIRPETLWTDAGFTAPDGLRILLVGACSSFAGVSVAIAVHVGWAMRVRTSLTRFDALAILATGVLATVINITRLVLTGWSEELFVFWHGTDGSAPGLMIAWFLQTAAILAGGYISATWAGRAEE